MALERNWSAISARPLTSDGTDSGKVTISSTKNFKVKQQVLIKATTQPDLLVEVKRVISSTELLVGPKGSIKLRTNISSYTTALSASISAPEQERPSISPADYERFVIEEEPTLAKRVILVDSLGNKIDDDDGAIDVNIVNKLFKKKKNKITMTYDPITQDMATITTLLNGIPQEIGTLTYDSLSNLIDIEVVDA
jgi:hypothetical protein